MKKEDNVQILTDCELTEMQKHRKLQGVIGLVQFGHGGLKKRRIPCDAVVFCEGSTTSRLLKIYLSHSVPVITIKQYSGIV